MHYVRWELTEDQVAAFGAGPVELVVDHPNYRYGAQLGESTHAELLGDLRNGG